MTLVARLKAALILGLVAKVEAMESKMERMEEVFMKREEELDRHLRSDRAEGGGEVVDRPTQLICIWIFICQHTTYKRHSRAIC